MGGRNRAEEAPAPRRRPSPAREIAARALQILLLLVAVALGWVSIVAGAIGVSMIGEDVGAAALNLVVAAAGLVAAGLLAFR